MIESKTLSKSEVETLVTDWYKALDVHAPVETLLPMLLDQGLEMRFPEATLHGHEEFKGWYRTVTNRFFDEVHEMKELDIQPADDRADVKLCVKWQAKIWDPPAANSKWLGFDAYQTWVVKRSPESGRAVIASYGVDELRPLEGSASL